MNTKNVNPPVMLFYIKLKENILLAKNYIYTQSFKTDGNKLLFNNRDKIENMLQVKELYTIHI